MTADASAFLLKQATYQSYRLAITAGFCQDDLEDVAQELIADVIRRSAKFDAARGSWRGFVRAVMRHHTAKLVTLKRRHAPEVLGADYVRSHSDSDADWIDVLDKRQASAVENAMQLGLDMAGVLAKLPVQHQSVALLLGEMTVGDVCRRTCRSRSGVFQIRKQIRKAFIAAGLAPSHATHVARSN